MKFVNRINVFKKVTCFQQGLAINKRKSEGTDYLVVSAWSGSGAFFHQFLIRISFPIRLLCSMDKKEANKQ